VKVVQGCYVIGGALVSDMAWVQLSCAVLQGRRETASTNLLHPTLFTLLMTCVCTLCLLLSVL
jgi:hypothetical protein